MKTEKDFKKHIFYALENSDVSPKEIITDDAERVIVKIDKNTCPLKIKTFINFLNEQKLRFKSSFNPENEIINIFIF